MKKSLLLTIMCLACLSSYAQIPTMTAAAPKEEPKKLVYDSTKNWLNHNDYDLKAYIGQELFVRPLYKTLQQYGYDNFKTKAFSVNDEKYSNKFTLFVEPRNYRTPYNKLVNKTFIVTNVEKMTNSNYDYLFTLVDKADPTFTCKYVYECLYEHSFHFITMGYYVQLCQKYDNKEYVISNSVVSETDINTGEKMVFDNENYTLYTTTKEITISEDGGELYVKIINHDGQISQCKIKNIEQQPNLERKAFKLEDWRNNVDYYGINMMTAVMKGTIPVGMPKLLVYWSWGMPEEINKSSYGPDQWVYDDQYLYIENGKVTAWN